MCPRCCLPGSVFLIQSHDSLRLLGRLSTFLRCLSATSLPPSFLLCQASAHYSCSLFYWLLRQFPRAPLSEYFCTRERSRFFPQNAIRRWFWRRLPLQIQPMLWHHSRTLDVAYIWRRPSCQSGPSCRFLAGPQSCFLPLILYLSHTMDIEWGVHCDFRNLRMLLRMAWLRGPGDARIACSTPQWFSKVW